jgi:hypothetical protein
VPSGRSLASASTAHRTGASGRLARLPRRSQPDAPAPAGFPARARRGTRPRRRSRRPGCAAVRTRPSRRDCPTGRGRRPSPSSARDTARDIGQPHQPPDRAVEHARHVVDAPLPVRVQVRPAGIHDQQRVASEHQPGFIGAPAIGHHVGVVGGCVARRRDRGHHRVAELDDVAIGQRTVREPDAGVLRQVRRRSGARDEPRAAPRRDRPASASRTPRRSARAHARPERCTRRRGRCAGRLRRTRPWSCNRTGTRRTRSCRLRSWRSTWAPRDAHGCMHREQMSDTTLVGQE